MNPARTRFGLTAALRWFTASLLVGGILVAAGGSIADDAVPGIPEAQLGDPVDTRAVTPNGIDLAASGFGDDGHVWQPSEVRWPESTRATVGLDNVARWVAESPVSLASDDAVGQTTVEIYGQEASKEASVDGVLLRLDSTTEGTVELGVDYSGFAGAFGGAWASRLHVMELDDCESADPGSCRMATAIPSQNNVTTSLLSAKVTSTGLYVVTAEASSEAGSYTATDLSPAGSWSAGGNSGGFSYNYPLRTPPASGPVPALGLSYSSQSHDGRTSGSNNQASWIGDGWSYEPGYIERSFVGCGSDSKEGNNSEKKTGDRCWDGDSNAMTLSLNGTNTSLVKDDTKETWHAASDSGWKIEKLGSAATSTAATTESWLVTTTDGTQYTFGSVAAARWTVPVFGNHSGEECYTSTFAASSCLQAYRWQVEKAVDVHGNKVSYTYETETGYYGAGGDVDKRVSYIRGGYLSRIDYGLRSNDSTVTPSARVVFTPGNRCLSDCGTASAPTVANWPDTPWDLDCKTTPCTDQTAPAFFSTKRLAKITTQVAEGVGFRDVDSWTLNHEFKDYGDSSQVVMWLKSIQHTGHIGEAITLPATTFEGVSMPNRVETGTGIPAIWRSRITAVTTETGGVIGVTYSAPDCTAGGLLPADESNSRLCYPVWWTPEHYWEPEKDWFHKYIVHKIVEQDTTADSLPITTSYEYSTTGGGTSVLWAWDNSEFTEDDHRTYSQWRGYAQVTTKIGDPAQGQTLNSRTSYYRGLDGQRLPVGTRSVDLTDSEKNTVADHEALAGSVFETVQLDGTTIHSASVSKYWKKKTATRSHDGGALDAWMTGESERSTRKHLTGTVWQRTRTVTEYDERGRVIEIDDLGDLTTADDDLCARTEYGENAMKRITAAVTRTETVSVACTAATSRPADVVGDTRTFYDDSNTFGFVGSRGLPTKVEEIDSWNNGPVYHATATNTYDNLGRPLTASDALDRETTTSYTPAGPGPTTASTVTNPLGHAVTTEFEPAWGAETATIDANNRRTDLAYDALGRVTGVWLPGQSRSAGKPAHHKFSYNLSSTAPSTVTSQRITPGSTYITTITVYDSLLRDVQIQADTPVGGRLLTETSYNTRGEKRYSSGPNYDDTATPNGELARVEQGADHARTVFNYDGLGRTISEEFWSKNVHRWNTAYAYGGSSQGFLTTITPPAQGIKTATLTNARGQDIEKRQYRADGTFAPVYYTFTPTGELKKVVDSVGNMWTYEYDLRGNKIEATDPDTGTTTLDYDQAGQRTSRTDAEHRTVSTVYDDLGRVSATWAGEPDNGMKLTDRTYDTVTGGLGLPTASRSYVNGELAVTNRIGKYDVAGRPTQHYTDIAVMPGLEKLAGSYLYTTTYAVDGQIASMGLGGYGGMEAEGVAYGYSATGQPAGMVGTLKTTGTTEVYVSNATYTAFAELAQRTLSDKLGRKVYETFTYEDGTHRRQSYQLSVDGVSTQITKLDYAYDAVGNTVSISDAGGLGGEAERQCFQYDDLRQLAEAWAQAGTGACATKPSASVLGGPAAYWSSYTHAVTGNRLSETKHTGNENAIYTYKYPTAGKPGAHTVSEIEHSVATDSYKYDLAGNMIQREVAGNTETFAWDQRGKLETIQDSDGTTQMVYDADGNRVARIDADGDATVFAAQYELSYAAATDQVSALRSYSHNGTVIATRSTSNGLVWSCGDHHNTATWTITAISKQITVRRQDPYGNDRGPSVPWNSGQKSFVGGTADPTGLVHIGARSYDPTTGRFISPDPISDYFDPQQINGYTYGNANPITNSDPTGLMCSEEMAALGCHSNRKKPGKSEPPASGDPCSVCISLPEFEAPAPPPIPEPDPCLGGASSGWTSPGSCWSAEGATLLAQSWKNCSGLTTVSEVSQACIVAGYCAGYSSGEKTSSTPYVLECGGDPGGQESWDYFHPGEPIPDNERGDHYIDASTGSSEMYGSVTLSLCFGACVMVTFGATGLYVAGGAWGSFGLGGSLNTSTHSLDDQSAIGGQACASFLFGACAAGGSTTSGEIWTGGSIVFGTGYYVGGTYTNKRFTW